MTDDDTGSPCVRAEMISTARLDLLPLRVEHAAEMAEVLKDPALHAFTGGAPHLPEALVARYERLVAGSPDPAVAWLNWPRASSSSRGQAASGRLCAALLPAPGKPKPLTVSAMP